MVETKAAKRKVAAKVARRASHELQTEVKRVEKVAADKKAGVSTPKAGTRAATRAAKAAEPQNDQEMIGALQQAGQDGSDSEGEEGSLGGQRLVVKLDSVQKKRLAKNLKEIADKPAEEPGQSSVVYLGRIPFGFFEDQMRSYFKQFGDIKRLRLSRNKKTGKSKNFAFIEFEHAEVAEIVASTHNNMLISDRAVKCAIVPKNKLHAKMWRGADEKFVPHNFKYAAKQVVNGKKTAAQEKARVANLVKKESAKRKKLASLGIEYDFKGYAGLLTENKPKRTKFSD